MEGDADDWLNQEGFSPISSPSPLSAGFITPLNVKYQNWYNQTPESILKISAMSFPNTPSILRKRKNEAEKIILRNKIGKGSGPNNQEENNRSDFVEKSGLHNGNLNDESPARVVNVVDALSDGHGNAFNSSPPYRLRNKRTSVVKSIEKQLEFTFNEEDSTVDRDTSIPSKMGVT